MDDELKTTTTIKFNEVSRAVVDAENAIRYSLSLQQSMVSPDIGTGKQLDLFKYSPIDTSNTTPKQNLFYFY